MLGALLNEKCTKGFERVVPICSTGSEVCSSDNAHQRLEQLEDAEYIRVNTLEIRWFAACGLEPVPLTSIVSKFSLTAIQIYSNFI